MLKTNASNILEMYIEIFTDTMIQSGICFKLILGEIRRKYIDKTCLALIRSLLKLGDDG